MIVCSRRQFIASTAAACAPLNNPLRAGPADDKFQLALQELSAETGPSLRQFGEVGTHEFQYVVVPNIGTASGSIRLQKRSSRKIGDRANNLIIRCEVTSPERYNAAYRSPIWPQGASGVTIGIGYDLGYVQVDDFKENWDGYLDAQQISLLTPVVGRKGTDAQALLADVSSVQISWTAAQKQFLIKTLPFYVAETESAFPYTEDLRPDAFGALVSIVFNRGSASYYNAATKDYGLVNDPRREVRAIKEAMAKRKFDEIPAHIRSMKRLWERNPKAKGLISRREAEASLFELGIIGT